jgi:transcription elongation factor Elf1
MFSRGFQRDSSDAGHALARQQRATAATTPDCPLAGRHAGSHGTTLRCAVAKKALPYIDSLVCVDCGSSLVRLTGTQVDTDGVVAPNAKCPSCGQRFRFRDPEDRPA